MPYEDQARVVLLKALSISHGTSYRDVSRVGEVMATWSDERMKCFIVSFIAGIFWGNEFFFKGRSLTLNLKSLFENLSLCLGVVCFHIED